MSNMLRRTKHVPAPAIPDPLYFFLLAVGYKVPWTAISSLLHQLNQQFNQPRVLLWLNLAYFVPSMPALLLHGSLQDWLEHRMGVPKAAMARFIFGLGSLVLLCLLFPYCCGSLPALLGATAAVGVAYSVAFGTSHQLAPRFSQQCTVALNAGFVSCGVVVLLADLALKPNSAHYTPAALHSLFGVTAAQVLVGLLAAALLLRRHWWRLQDTGKQQQHHIIGVLPPPGSNNSSNSSRAGSIGFPCSSGGSGVFSGSSGSSRQLLLPPRPGWGSGSSSSSFSSSGVGMGLRHVQHSSGTAGDYSNSHLYNLAQQGEAGSAVSQAVPLLGDAGVQTGQLPVQVTIGSSGSSGSGEAYGYTAAGGAANAMGQAPQQHNSSNSTSLQEPRSWGLGVKQQQQQQQQQHPSSSSSRLRQRLRPTLLLLQLAWRICPAWLGLLLSVSSSMLLFPLFTCVDTSGRLGERLPQVLFYSRLLGDILGRLVPPAWQLRSSRSVLTAAFLKTKLLLVLIPAILQPSLVGGDINLAGLVALNWWLSGYINTGAYLLAPRLATLEAEAGGLDGLGGLAGRSSSSSKGLGSGRKGFLGFIGFWRRLFSSSSSRHSKLPVGKRDHHGFACSSSSSRKAARDLQKMGAGALRSKAGAVMALCFQISCFVGLMGAWVLQELLHSSGHPAFAAAGDAAAAAPGAELGLQGAGLGLLKGGGATAAAAAAGGGGVWDGFGAPAAAAGVMRNAVNAVVAAAGGAMARASTQAV